MMRVWYDRRAVRFLWAAALMGAGCTGGRDVVARAGPYELPVEQYARILAGWPHMPLREDMAERWAHRWVEYALFADRVARGDSLLDSATIFRAKWPEIDTYLRDRYREHLFAERVRLDSAVVDSVYAAGEQRLVEHILVVVWSGMPQAEVDRRRRRIEGLRARLMAGRPWEEVVKESEDRETRLRSGRLEPFTRGTMARPFEDAAFALAPGEISPVVETPAGYHVIRRPPLAEVREDFTQHVRQLLMAQLDSVWMEEVGERWNVRVREDAPEKIRRIAETPLQWIVSDDVLATYRGGRFTAASFVRWLRALPPDYHFNIPTATDLELIDFVHDLVIRDLKAEEARRAGVTLPPEIFVEVRFQVRRHVEDLRERMGLNRALEGLTDLRERRRAAAGAVEAFLTRVAQREDVAVFVPTFLSDVLRAEERWSVSLPALQRVLAEAHALRQSATASTAPNAEGRGGSPHD